MNDEPRFGRAKYQTIRRDFAALRIAIRSHDSFAAEVAWEKCERWLEAVPMSLPKDDAA